MVNDTEGKSVQMKLVDCPPSDLPNLQKAADKKRQRQLKEEMNRNEIYKLAVQEVTEHLDRSILNQLAETQKKLEATQNGQEQLLKALSIQSKHNADMVAQNSRYQNSLDKIVESVQESIINNQNPHIAYCDRDWGISDTVVTKGHVPSEIVYKYTTGVLGQFVGISAGRMGAILRKFDIFGDPKFYYAFPTGPNSICHKYKITVLKEIFLRRKEPKFIDVLKPNEITQIHSYLKMEVQERGL